MTSVTIHKKAKEAKLRLVVHRADGTVEDLGVVSYWHRNPFLRLWWKLTHPKQAGKGFKTRRAQLNG